MKKLCDCVDRCGRQGRDPEGYLKFWCPYIPWDPDGLIYGNCKLVDDREIFNRRQETSDM